MICGATKRHAASEKEETPSSYKNTNEHKNSIEKQQRSCHQQRKTCSAEFNGLVKLSVLSPSAYQIKRLGGRSQREGIIGHHTYMTKGPSSLRPRIHATFRDTGPPGLQGLGSRPLSPEVTSSGVNKEPCVPPLTCSIPTPSGSGNHTCPAI